MSILPIISKNLNGYSRYLNLFNCTSRTSNQKLQISLHELCNRNDF